MARVDWMDRLTFREIEILNNNEKKKSQQVSYNCSVRVAQ